MSPCSLAKIAASARERRRPAGFPALSIGAIEELAAGMRQEAS
jgi:hypothetical protein